MNLISSRLFSQLAQHHRLPIKSVTIDSDVGGGVPVTIELLSINGQPSRRFTETFNITDPPEKAQAFIQKIKNSDGMSHTEYLVTCLTEECSRLAAECSKAMRKPGGKSITNATRIRLAFADLQGAYDMLIKEGILTAPSSEEIGAKKSRVKMDYSTSIGAL